MLLPLLLHLSMRMPMSLLGVNIARRVQRLPVEIPGVLVVLLLALQIGFPLVIVIRLALLVCFVVQLGVQDGVAFIGISLRRQK